MEKYYWNRSSSRDNVISYVKQLLNVSTTALRQQACYIMNSSSHLLLHHASTYKRIQSNIMFLE